MQSHARTAKLGLKALSSSRPMVPPLDHDARLLPAKYAVSCAFTEHAMAQGSSEASVIKAYWQPGCTSCLRMKEFLTKHGVAFVSVNVLEDKDAFAELTALGIRSVPIVRRGSEQSRCALRSQFGRLFPRYVVRGWPSSRNQKPDPPSARQRIARCQWRCRGRDQPGGSRLLTVWYPRVADVRRGPPQCGPLPAALSLPAIALRSRSAVLL